MSEISAAAISPKGISLTTVLITPFQQAINYVDSVGQLAPSKFWPNIKPELFIENLKINIHHPLSPYQGYGTRFCGYGALTYLLIQEDPLGYTKLLLQLYKNGQASYRNNIFTPSSSVQQAAGSIQFKGLLDIRPAEQMWYLSLADHFKGYLNIFNRRYNPGDETHRWAAVNYSKFNRMVKKMLPYTVTAKGSDLIRPDIDDLYTYISDQLKTGTVILYVNNRQVHKKNQTKIKLDIPTHFIVLKDIFRKDGLVTLIYWDYGGKTLMELRPDFFKKVVFGITHCAKQHV